MRTLNEVVATQTNNLKAKVEGAEKVRHSAIADLMATTSRQRAEVDAKCERCPRCGVMVACLYPVAMLCKLCLGEFKALDRQGVPKGADPSLFVWFDDLLGKVFKGAKS